LEIGGGANYNTNYTLLLRNHEVGQRLKQGCSPSKEEENYDQIYMKLKIVLQTF
jgi:hypothetical protein